MNQKGFTLIELLVYMMVAALVVTFAAKAWFDSAVFSMGSERRMELSSEMASLQYSLERDFGDLGISHLQNRNDMYDNDLVYIDAANGDFSSYEFVNNGTSDEIQYRIGQFDDAGLPEGYELIKLHTIGDSLIRSRTVFDNTGSQTSQDSVILSERVSQFDLKLGVYEPHSMDSDSIVYELTFDDTKAGNDYLEEDTNAYTSPIVDTASNQFGFTTTTQDFPHYFHLEDGNGSWTSVNVTPGKTYTLKFDLTLNNDYKSSFNLAHDSIVIKLTAPGGTAAALEGTEPYKVFPSGSNTVSHAYDFNTPDSVFNITLISRLKRITGSPSLSLSNVRVQELSLAEVSFLDSLGSGAHEMTSNKNGTKSILAQIELFETVGLDTTRYQAQRTFPVPNNGVQ